MVSLSIAYNFFFKMGFDTDLPFLLNYFCVEPWRAFTRHRKYGEKASKGWFNTLVEPCPRQGLLRLKYRRVLRKLLKWPWKKVHTDYVERKNYRHSKQFPITFLSVMSPTVIILNEFLKNRLKIYRDWNTMSETVSWEWRPSNFIFETNMQNFCESHRCHLHKFAIPGS